MSNEVEGNEVEGRLRAACLGLKPPDRETEQRALAAALSELPLPEELATPASKTGRLLRPLRRPRRALAVLIAAIATLGVGASLWATVWSGSSSPDGSASSVIVGDPGQLTERFPSDTLTDLVSYADQVSIVSVESEEALPPDPEDVATGEGYVGRSVTLALEDTIWRRDGAPSAGDLVRVIAEGWVLQEGRRLKYANWGAPRLEVGRQYIVPLVRTPRDGVDWTVLSTYATLPFDGATVTTEGILEGGPSFILEEVAGMSADELADRLARTPPDPLALKYGHLDPEERVQRVFREKGLTD